MIHKSRSIASESEPRGLAPEQIFKLAQEPKLHIAAGSSRQFYDNRPGGQSEPVSFLAMTSESSTKTAPVIVITGTPGTGKTTTAQLLAEESPVSLKHINIGEWVKEKDLHEGFDEDWQSYTVDEDKVPRISYRHLLISDMTTMIATA